MRFSKFGLGFSIVACAAALFGCGGSEDDEAGDDGDKGGSGSGGVGTGGSAPTGGSAGRGGSTSGSGGGGQGGSGAVGGGKMGDPGCGLDAAAFCDNFNEPSDATGRGGELDVRLWSASRDNPQLATGNGVAVAAGPATLPVCRPGLPETVFPDQDTLVCNPNDTIDSNHLLVAVGAQNYGQNSYRIRQPFDFAGRTGKIVFDAEGWLLGPLFGWISLEVTEDPTPAPSFSIGAENQTNDEGGAVPRNAFEVQFADTCPGYPQPSFTVRLIDVLENYEDDVLEPTDKVCVASGEGKLNHFEITVSQSRIEVYASPASDDGVTYGPVELLFGADVDLPFSRGYVHITTHNHATLKYSQPGMDFGADHSLDAWIARWDNVGFDGPIIDNFREYEIPDSLVLGEDSQDISGPVMSTGYTVGDASEGPEDVFTFSGVDLSGVTSARIALGTWYDIISQPASAEFSLQYRLNGGAWHDRRFTPGELAVMTNGHAQGSLGQMLDVPVAELVDGDNTLEFQTDNVPMNYPPAVWAIDLVLETD